MPPLTTIQNGYVPLRNADVTADDTGMDTETSGQRLTDITTRDVFELGGDANGIEIIGWAEGVENDTFGCELWGLTPVGGRKVGTLLCDLTGTAGTAFADITNVDSTARLFLDDITVSTDTHLKGVGVTDQGNDRICKVALDTMGLWGLYARFYTVGGAGECERINLWARPY